MAPASLVLTAPRNYKPFSQGGPDSGIVNMRHLFCVKSYLCFSGSKNAACAVGAKSRNPWLSWDRSSPFASVQTERGENKRQTRAWQGPILLGQDVTAASPHSVLPGPGCWAQPAPVARVTQRGQGTDVLPRDTAHQAAGETRPPMTADGWRSQQSPIAKGSAGDGLAAQGSAQWRQEGGTSARTPMQRHAGFPPQHVGQQQ